MKTVNYFDLIESHCSANNCFAVHISADQFWNESENDFEPEYQIYVDRVFEKFEKEQARDIISATLCNELCTFETKEEAMKLYKIMEAEEFENKFFACIGGPKGLITENT